MRSCELGAMFSHHPAIHWDNWNVHVSRPGREAKLVTFKDDDVQRPSYLVVFGIIAKHKITF